MSFNVALMGLALKKRKTQDYLLTSIRYRFHHFQHIAHIKEEKQQTKEQVNGTKEKLLFKHDKRDLDFRFWRNTDVT